LPLTIIGWGKKMREKADENNYFRFRDLPAGIGLRFERKSPISRLHLRGGDYSWYKQTQSTRQLEDILSVIEIQKSLDKTYLNKWINKLGLLEEWRELGDIK